MNVATYEIYITVLVGAAPDVQGRQSSASAEDAISQFMQRRLIAEAEIAQAFVVREYGEPALTLWNVAVPTLCAISKTPLASTAFSSTDGSLLYARKQEGSIYAQTGVFTVQGATVYEHGIALPSIVCRDDARLLNSAIADRRLDWQGHESRLEHGQWVTRDQGTDRTLYTSPLLSNTWLWLNNWF